LRFRIKLFRNNFHQTLSDLSALPVPLRQRNALCLSLPNEENAVSRVTRRGLQDGHNIPEDVIRWRFKAGLAKFHDRYSKIVGMPIYEGSGTQIGLVDSKRYYYDGSAHQISRADGLRKINIIF
jgi:hypothetical protein